MNCIIFFTIQINFFGLILFGKGKHQENSCTSLCFLSALTRSMSKGPSASQTQLSDWSVGPTKPPSESFFPRVHCSSDPLVTHAQPFAARLHRCPRRTFSQSKMADNQDYNNGFNQDITDQEYQQDDQMNGGGEAPQDSGSAEAPGKDDER